MIQPVKRKSGQLPLELRLEPRFGREDFLVSPSNELAFNFFEAWPAWPGNMVLLAGPAGSGKSHLGAIWAAKAQACVLSAASLAIADIPVIASARAVLLEDADDVANAESQLFHLINLVREKGGWLAMTARKLPDHWGVKTPDLLSRLRLATAMEISAPDDALVRAVLVKLFVDRQLTIDTSLIEFLAMRIERSLEAVRRIVDLLDREALAQGRAVTRPMAAQVIAALEAGESA